jgi:hypothetical protein
VNHWRLPFGRITAATHIVRSQAGLVAPLNLGALGFGLGRNLLYAPEQK